MHRESHSEVPSCLLVGAIFPFPENLWAETVIGFLSHETVQDHRLVSHIFEKQEERVVIYSFGIVGAGQLPPRSAIHAALLNSLYTASSCQPLGPMVSTLVPFKVAASTLIPLTSNFLMPT